MASPNSSDAAGLRIQDFQSIMDVLADVQNDWKSIGVALGLPQCDLDSIQNYISNSSTPLSDTLKLWLQSERHHTVEHLANVLQDVGKATVAQKLTEKFTCYKDGEFHCIPKQQSWRKLFHIYSTHVPSHNTLLIMITGHQFCPMPPPMQVNFC